jgi:hypothetical protein
VGRRGPGFLVWTQGRTLYGGLKEECFRKDPEFGEEI